MDVSSLNPKAVDFFFGSEEKYVRQADAGTGNFLSDGNGFGLCKWSEYEDKKGLLETCRQKNYSVGDEECQLIFLMDQLKYEYSRVLHYMQESNDLKKATNFVCSRYFDEHYNCGRRYNYAKECYEKFVEE